MRIYLIGIWSIFLSSVSYAQDYTKNLGAVQTAKQLGEYIYAKSIEHSDTNLRWVKYNSPSYSVRFELFWKGNIFEGGFEKNQAPGFIQNFSQAKFDDKEFIIRLVTSTREMKDYLKFIPDWISSWSTTYAALEIAEPRYRDYMGSQLLSSVWIEVLSDPSYVLPLLELTVEIHKDIKERNVRKGDFQQDLVAAFKKHGKSNEEAQHMAWNILGLYGSRGANITEWAKTFDRKDTGLGYALRFLSNCLAVLDATPGTTHPYSLPTSVKTKMSIGKPYHFWMSAYLAYRLRLEGRDAYESAAGPFNISKIYEYYFSGNGRADINRSYEIVSLPLYHPMINSIRIGHALHAAGASYGACLPIEKCSRRLIDLDVVLDQGLLHSKKAKFVVDDRPFYLTLARHLNFDKVTASDVIFTKAFQQKNLSFP